MRGGQESVSLPLPPKSLSLLRSAGIVERGVARVPAAQR
jgi:hypothetical protein